MSETPGQPAKYAIPGIGRPCSRAFRGTLWALLFVYFGVSIETYRLSAHERPITTFVNALTEKGYGLAARFGYQRPRRPAATRPLEDLRIIEDPSDQTIAAACTE